jgi:hypothetical protein
MKNQRFLLDRDLLSSRGWALLASQFVIPAKRSASRDRIKAGAPRCYDPGLYVCFG